MVNDGKISATARILVFFTCSPDEQLTVNDMAVKFDIPPEAVNFTLRKMVDAQLLERIGGKAGRGNGAVYTPGPTLLNAMGLGREKAA